MKYCVLGSGLMGRAIAYDLLTQNDTEQVVLVDKNVEALRATLLQNDSRLQTKTVDVSNVQDVINVLKDADAAVAAIHYAFNPQFTKAAIETKTHLCDLGGNNTIVEEQLKLNDEAKKAGISVIPDCGLAPGMVAVLVKWGIEKFNWAHSVKIRVGGLPQNPINTLKYGRLFSVEGLINEYIEPVKVLRNGKIETIEPLCEIEEIEFPSPFYTLEAFTTSGGVSTLVETYKNKLKNLDYKTIRYPGHCSIVRSMYELGLFAGESRKVTAKLIEKNIPICTEDATLVKIIFEGDSKKHELTIIDKPTKKPDVTSMMRMTAYPAAIISQMQARKKINPGVQTQENCVPADLFITELEKRNIVVNGLISMSAV